jgi:hypothetical protein
MKTFNDLDFNPHPNGMGGVQARIPFPNGYGASVVCNPFSYGGREGLYEIAVLNSEGRITYGTPITDDVIGYLNENEVTDILKQIQSLENAT